MESVWHEEELEALRYKVLFNKARPDASTLGLVLSLLPVCFFLIDSNRLDPSWWLYAWALSIPVLLVSLYARVSGTLAVGGVLLFLPWILWFFPPIF